MADQPRYNISGYKINDTNGNGIWDSGEAGIQGWNITLLNASTGAFIASNLTNASGFYQFRNLSTNTYNVSEERRTGWDNTNATSKVVNPAADITNLNFTNKRSNKIDSCITISSPGEYVLTTNINSASTCINITSSNVTFDGAGYTINGTRTSGTYGVYVYNSSITVTNVTVRNLNVTNWNYGIYYQNAKNGSVANNTTSSNSGDGITLFSSSNNNTLTSNIASSNGDTGIRLQSSSYNNLIRNTANSNHNNNGITLSYSSNNNALINNNASSNAYGITLGTSSNNNSMSGNNASLNAFYGI